MKKRLLKTVSAALFLAGLMFGSAFFHAQAVQWPASPLPSGWTITPYGTYTITGENDYHHIVTLNLQNLDTDLQHMWPDGTHWLRTLTITGQKLGSCSGTLSLGIPGYAGQWSADTFTLADNAVHTMTFNVFKAGYDVFLQPYTGNGNYFSTTQIDWYGAADCDFNLDWYTFSDGTHTATQEFFYSMQYDTVDFSGPTALINRVEWQNPPYTAGMTTPDLKNWWVCNYINDAGSAAGSPAYYNIFEYGTSSPYTYTDDSRDSLQGTTPIYKWPLDECPLIPKTHDLAPGSYEAIAGLYRQDGSWIASSSLLTFTVSSGTPVNYPGQEKKPIVDCTFNVSDTGVSAVDDTVNGIINGLCTVGTFLAVPSQTSIDNFGLVWDGVKQKPPFGYFTITSNELLNVSTTTVTSTPSSTLPNLAGITWFTDKVDQLFALLILVSFTWFLWHRMRKFEF